MIAVHIACKPVASEVWKHIKMEPADYFWSDPEDPTRRWTVDSTPKHDVISQLLISIGSEPLKMAITRVMNDETGDYCERAYHFHGNHESYVCLATDKLGERTERELILAGSFPFKDNGSQVVRITLTESVPMLTMNTFMWGIGGDEHSIDMLRVVEANKALQSRRETRAPER